MAAGFASSSDRRRRIARRVVVASFAVGQLAFVVRAYGAPHGEFGYQMFPESSTWSAEIVRVTRDGQRVPVSEPWAGYDWNELAGIRGLGNPWRVHHADAGLDSQLAFLDEALDWVARNTPDDTETRHLVALVTTSHNGRAPEVLTIRSVERSVP